MVYRYRLHPDGCEAFESMSAGAGRVFGVAADTAMADARTIWDRVHSDDIPRLRGSVAESAATGRPWGATFRVRRDDGSLRWLRGESVPEPPGADGGRIWNGIVLDVTEAKHAEADLRAMEARARLLGETGRAVLDGLPASIALLDQDGTILAVNRRWRQIGGPGGEPSRSAEGSNYLAVCDAAAEIVREARAAGEAVRAVLSGRSCAEALEHQCAVADGLRWFQASVTPVPVETGLGTVVMHVDVTERRCAEQALRESRFRALIEDLEVGVVLQDADDRVLLSNGAAQTLLGLTEDQLRGVSSRDPRWRLIRGDGSDRPSAISPAGSPTTSTTC